MKEFKHFDLSERAKSGRGLKGEGNFLPASVSPPPPARLGQNAEIKFSSSLLEFFGGARNPKIGEENFVEA